MVSQRPAKASNLLGCASSILAGSVKSGDQDLKVGPRNKCSGRRTETPAKWFVRGCKPKSRILHVVGCPGVGEKCK